MKTYQIVHYMDGQTYKIKRSDKNWNKAIEKQKARREYWGWHLRQVLNWQAWVIAIPIALLLSFNGLM